MYSRYIINGIIEFVKRNLDYLLEYTRNVQKQSRSIHIEAIPQTSEAVWGKWSRLFFVLIGLTQQSGKLLFVGMPLAPPLGELPKAEGVSNVRCGYSLTGDTSPDLAGARPPSPEGRARVR